jgi:hypothetical protein
MHNLVDAARIDANVAGQAILANAQRLEEFFQQDFARVNGREFLGQTVPDLGFLFGLRL